MEWETKKLKKKIANGVQQIISHPDEGWWRQACSPVTYMIQESFDGFRQVLHHFLPLVGLWMTGLVGHWNEVVQVRTGLVIADNLPYYPRNVEKYALQTQHERHPLVIHWKVQLSNHQKAWLLMEFSRSPHDGRNHVRKYPLKFRDSYQSPSNSRKTIKSFARRKWTHYWSF